MAGSSSIVDWNALSLNEGQRTIARLLREQLEVRLFVVTPDAELVDITPRCPGVETLFDHFVQADASWADGDERATMVRTRRRWAGELMELDTDAAPDSRDGCIVETAPGFTARVVPVVASQRIVGGVVAAGYVPVQKAASAVERIRRYLPDHLREAVDEPDGRDPPAIPQLSRADRHWARQLAGTLADRMARGLAEADDVVHQRGRRFGEMLAVSDAMKQVFDKIERVAPAESTVLITGENGTGKELVARAIHRHSNRCEGPFMAVNCAAIPEKLIASELFGHVRGAFSGAQSDREGLFEAAHGGTILLDEIGEMDPSLQTRLLRVLQQGTLVRVGDSEVRNVDVRVLCATNAQLHQLVEEGKFRRDLYFRIRVIELSVPPLRERRDDIELLANHFVTAAARRHDRGDKRLSSECLDQLRCYDWPGNVRELKNEVERLVIMSGDEEVIEPLWLRPPVGEASQPQPNLDFEGRTLPEVIESIERTMILDRLRNTGWNKSETARQLGVSRRNLIRKVKRYELEQYREDD